MHRIPFPSQQYSNILNVYKIYQIYTLVGVCKLNSLFCALFKRAKSNLLFHSFKKERKEQIAPCRSFGRERTSALLLVALLKQAKERFAPCRSFCKEQKSDLLFVALFKRVKE